MTPEELKQACDEADRQGIGWIVVNVPARPRLHRHYRVCKGLSGNVIGSSRSGMVTISIKVSKVRAFLSQLQTDKREKVMAKPESQKSDRGAAQFRISGSIPCVICWEPVTQEDVSRDEVIANVGRSIYPAHVSHYYTANWEKTPDHVANLERLALAYAVGEHEDLPYLEERLRPLYEELKEKMEGWDYAVFAVREARN